MTEEDTKSKSQVVSYSGIILILWIIALSNVTESESNNYDLYDYWRYGWNRLWISVSVISIAIIGCVISSCGIITNSETITYITSTLSVIAIMLCLLINIVFTYYFIATNNSAKDINFNQTGNTSMDMIQILSYISIICDYILSALFICTGMCTSLIYCVDKKDNTNNESGAVAFNNSGSRI
jgi:hypothetical protein